jgi:hypothetical protein
MSESIDSLIYYPFRNAYKFCFSQSPPISLITNFGLVFNSWLKQKLSQSSN